MDSSKRYSFFRKKLTEWYDPNQRPMPWKSEKDPYRIWLSEIILQQTRVEQGWPYYNRFIEQYPNVDALANASEDHVLKNWEGLGYYSRARNLHATAKFISKELKGVFPSEYRDIISLKGVGPYTAAAIASFAFNIPMAVVDGNVYRVLARFFGIEDPIDSTSGKKRFAALAQNLLDKTDPGTYNQSIIDFGATICKPKSPLCESCPLESQCIAKQNHLIDQLPYKSKKIKKKLRFFTYLILNHNNQILIRKRALKDIWKGLYEFPYIETSKLPDLQQILSHESFLKYTGKKYTIHKLSKPFQQALTHQKITACFLELNIEKPFSPKSEFFFSIQRNQLNNFAFPKIIDLYLRDKSLYLELL